MSDAKMYFKLSPELGDGCRSTIVEDVDMVIDAVRTWAVEASEWKWPNQKVSIRTVMMLEKDFEALDEI